LALAGESAATSLFTVGVSLRDQFGQLLGGRLRDIGVAVLRHAELPAARTATRSCGTKSSSADDSAGGDWRI
jgi:hypothetical protein